MNRPVSIPGWHITADSKTAATISPLSGRKRLTSRNAAVITGSCWCSAQELGLNTCWAALTHGKSKAAIAGGETEVIIIALGYGKTQGAVRKSKSAAEVSNLSPDAPEWFKRGVEAALLAPTAVNQQKFRFTLSGNRVSAKHGLIGSCLKVDLGIVKCHFELAAGKENFEWE